MFCLITSIKRVGNLPEGTQPASQWRSQEFGGASHWGRQNSLFS